MIKGLNAREKDLLVRALDCFRHFQKSPFIRSSSEYNHEIAMLRARIQRDLDHVGSYDFEEVEK
jgi:hypothetical protein